MPAGLAILRGLAEQEMRSACTITRPGTGGPRVWDEVTGTYTDPEPDIVYIGRCKVQDTARGVADAEAGEVDAGIADMALHLPIEGSGQVRRDDVAVIDANPDDEALVGKRFVIRGPHHGTAKTARRLPVKEVV